MFVMEYRGQIWQRKHIWPSNIFMVPRPTKKHGSVKAGVVNKGLKQKLSDKIILGKK